MKNTLLLCLLTVGLASCSKAGNESPPAPFAPSVAVLAAGTWQWTDLSYVATPKGGGAAVTSGVIVTPGAMAVTYKADGTMDATYRASSEVGSYTLTGSTLTTVLTSNPQLPSRTLASTVKELSATRLVLESAREDAGFRYIDTHTFAR